MKYFSYIINSLFFLLSILIPKKKNLIIFGCRTGRRYADNSRYLFLYLNKFYKKKFNCVWITREKKVLNIIRKQGFKCYYINSLKGCLLSLIANWTIFDTSPLDVNSFLSKFSKNIHLWHGILIKRISAKKYKNVYNFKIYKILNRLTSFFYPKYFCYPNYKFSYQIIDHYPINMYKLLLSNQPRNIMLLNSINNEELNIFRTKKEQNLYNKIKKTKKKIIGYFPTWRNDNENELFPGLKNLDQLKKLNNILKKNNYLLLIKKHSNSYKQDKHRLYNYSPEMSKVWKNISKYKNFLSIDYDIDLNSILSNCDILISDYSGVIMDFLLLDKPIFLYTPDIKKYKKKTGLLFDYNKIKIGPIINNYPQLLKTTALYLKNTEHSDKKYRKKRNIFKNQIFKTDEPFKNIIKVLSTN
tara:strand:+ start:995 stop:2233 length:1239 start_codon:yes stop_codon:yes gene_type:complete